MIRAGVIVEKSTRNAIILISMKLNTEWVAGKLPKRPKEANKGTFGKVLVIAGSRNYPGAAYLCSAAAYRVGAGLVTLATDETTKIIVSRKLPEVTFILPEEISFKEYDVCLIGPGLGQEEETIDFLGKLLKKKLPKTVIDGDGLNILAKIGNWYKLKFEAILTPHPGEMSRLTKLSINEIQSDRENIAKEFSKKWGQVVVLKGANTVIVSPAGEVRVSPFVNPVLATAGTGDVLAGCIVGFLAQGLKTFDAACVGVYTHGLAGESIRDKLGNAGALAGDLLPLLPAAIAHIQA